MEGVYGCGGNEGRDGWVGGGSGSDDQAENAFGCLSKQFEFYYVGTRNPTAVFKQEECLCFEGDCLPRAIIGGNPGSLGLIFQVLLYIFVPLLFQQTLLWAHKPLLALDGELYSRIEDKIRGCGLPFASIYHLYLWGNGTFEMIVITSHLCYFLDFLFPLIILISQTICCLALT
jgi:hypothetical protein